MILGFIAGSLVGILGGMIVMAYHYESHKIPKMLQTLSTKNINTRVSSEKTQSKSCTIVGSNNCSVKQ